MLTTVPQRGECPVTGPRPRAASGHARTGPSRPHGARTTSPASGSTRNATATTAGASSGPGTDRGLPPPRPARRARSRELSRGGAPRTSTVSWTKPVHSHRSVPCRFGARGVVNERPVVLQPWHRHRMPGRAVVVTVPPGTARDPLRRLRVVMDTQPRRRESSANRSVSLSSVKLLRSLYALFWFANRPF